MKFTHLFEGLTDEEAAIFGKAWDKAVLLEADLSLPSREQRLERALRAIIERADTDKPGTSKVQDMRYIAEKALEG